MAQCKWCSQSGWLLAVNRDGLCNQCRKRIGSEVKQRLRIINDSLRLIKESKNLDTRLHRIAVLLEHAGFLKQFEDKGIHVINPLPSEMITFANQKQIEFEERRDKTTESSVGRKDLKLKWGMSIEEAKKMIPKDNPMLNGPIRVSVTLTRDNGDKEECLDFEGELGELKTRNTLTFKNGGLDSVESIILGITKDNAMISYASIKQALVKQFGLPDWEDDEDDEDNGKFSYQLRWKNEQKQTAMSLIINESRDGRMRASLFAHPLKSK